MTKIMSNGIATYGVPYVALDFMLNSHISHLILRSPVPYVQLDGTTLIKWCRQYIRI